MNRASGTLTVTVDGKAITGVSAVGIGHLRKDLVLVFPATETDKERSEEMGSAWTCLEVVKE